MRSSNITAWSRSDDLESAYAEGAVLAAGTLTVGVDKQYQTIAAAIAASQDGDTILVDAGTYTNDWASIATDVTLTAVGGMVHMVSTGNISNGKAILITNGNVTINGFEFSGAMVADANGAGIRYESGALVLNNCYFHDNQNGLLGAADPTGTITIDNSEFAFNGVGGVGQTHNLYVGQIQSVTITDSYFHDANVGHEIKSRALNTSVLNSRIQDQGGTASYSIDCPNGGNVLIQGNVIEQGPNSENPTIVAVGEEGGVYANTYVLLRDNTIIDHSNQASDLALWNQTGTTAILYDNSFFGDMQIVSGPNTEIGSVFLTSDPPLDTSHPFNPVPCFVRGTRILTPQGEQPVENLNSGDLVYVVGDDEWDIIKWIGRRSYDEKFLVRHRNALPICIARDAISDGIPNADLLISPEHALVIDGYYLPARCLVNDSSIYPVASWAGQIDYFHIELNAPGVLIANGAHAESFVDYGGRHIFHNANEFTRLCPDAKPGDWEAYEALLEQGRSALPAIKKKLMERAALRHADSRIIAFR